MKNISRITICLSFLLTSNSLFAAVLPFLSFRSQEFNDVRELVCWQKQTNKFGMDKNYATFALTTEFMDSFDSEDITKALFCDALSKSICSNSCSTIKIQGTKFPNRTSNALLAEYFYLPTDFSSEVKFHPSVENFLIDANLYIGLDGWCKGLYFRIHSPLCHTRYNLNMCERTLDTGSLNYDTGYFNNTYTPIYDRGGALSVHGISRNALLNSFTEYACQGKSLPNDTTSTYYPLNYARFGTASHSKTAFADITAALGYNFLLEQDYTFGISIRAVTPTGNRPTGRWIFEPIVGNKHHCEIGAGINSSYQIWKNACENKDVSLYLDANVSYLCKAHECRTFDLCDKPLSRYMLALKFDDTVKNLTARQPDETTFIAPLAQFTGEFMPLANLTTIPVNVSATQGEMVIKCAYTHNNFEWDLGYNLWGRSCEKIKKCRPINIPEKTWALKGDAFVYGFPFDPTPNRINQPGIPLSASQSKSTIFNGTNNYPDGALIEDGTLQAFWNQNPVIDNNLRAFDATTPTNNILTTHLIGDIVAGFSYWRCVQTSYPEPEYINECDIDIKSASSRGLSQKVFTNFNYTWNETCKCTRYLGFGAEIEFGKNSMCTSNSCAFCSLSQWGVWIKGGITFE